MSEMNAERLNLQLVKELKAENKKLKRWLSILHIAFFIQFTAWAVAEFL